MKTAVRRSVVINGVAISYVLHRKDVKNLNLRIRPNGSIVVSARPEVQESVIDAFVVSKGKTIHGFLQNLQEQNIGQPQAKEYISGESFTILGRSLRLKVEESKPENVHSDGAYLHLVVADKTNKQRKALLVRRFLSNLRVEVFGEVMGNTYQLFKKYGVEKPQLITKDMQTRWGSCSKQTQSIILNKRLIEVPRPCIEYVVLHEFCHFLHPNHSRQFYDFVAMLMPDWKERKELLERSGG